MRFEFPGIILGDKLYSVEDLIFHCERQLATGNLPDWEKKIFKFIIDFFDERDFVEQTSSGTTGEKKTFKLPKRAMIESARMTIDILGLKCTDKALLCLPVDYIAGKMMIVRSLIVGMNLFWEEPTSMPSLNKYGEIDFCAMVPLQVYNSFSNYEFFKNIKKLIIGGAELRPELVAMFRDFPNITYITYGMAETCSHIALRKISGADAVDYFQVLPGIKTEVDTRGCLIIDAPYLDNQVVTNDLVEFIKEDKFIWKGRIDNLINSGGKKINPEELEANISKIIDKDCVIIGLPDDKLGQKIVLVIEGETVNTKKVQLKLQGELSKHQLPREIILLAEFPRNESFKVDRKKIEELVS